MSARKRRTKGDGSLFLRKDGMWVGSVEAGWKPDGTRARKYVSSRSQAEALAKLRKARSAVERTGTVPTRTTTVEKWLDLWLTHIANVKPTIERGFDYQALHWYDGGPGAEGVSRPSPPS